MSKTYLGVDIGGTAVKLGLVDENGRVLRRAERSVSFDGYKTPILDTVQAAIHEFLTADAPRLEGIAVSATGQIDSRRGVVAGTCGNFPGWIGVDIKGTLERAFGLPVTVANDANCMLLGEVWAGAAKGYTDVIGVTLGTGVGGGIVIENGVYAGFNFAAAELGHIVIDFGGEQCACGRRGCWEQYASATALIRRTEAAMAAHPESALCRLAEEAGGVDGRTPFLAAEAGDETALAVCRAYVEELAEGTASLINILRPEAVAFGGGVAGAPEHLLLEPLRRRVGALCFSRHGGRATRILRAELGNDAGVIGAALIGLQA